MVSVMKLNEPKAQLIKLYDNELEIYLKNYNIAKDLFDVSIIKNNCDKVVLRRYYDSEFERAITMLMDDEVVGIAFDNIAIMEQLLGESKLVKRMM